MSCRGRVYVVLGALFSYFFPEASLTSCSGQVVPSIQVIILSEGPQGRLQNQWEGSPSLTPCGLLSALLEQFHFQALEETS